MKYTIAPATEGDAYIVAKYMRDEDAAEVIAEGWSPIDALLQSMAASREPMAWRADGEPLCLFGIAAPTILSTVGVPWILTTRNLPQHWRPFLRGSRKWIEQVRQEYALLVNCVDARYRLALDWLEWLGFEIGEPEPFGPFGLPFCRAELRS